MPKIGYRQITSGPIFRSRRNDQLYSSLLVRRLGPVPLDRVTIEKREKLLLSPHAAFSFCAEANDRRLHLEAKDPHRARFARDRDRVTHSNHFVLLAGKTQVFPVLPEIIRPIITTRTFHVLRVAQLARTIARALRLNEDLTEAIALGHDIGHIPFGHAGERAVQEASAADISLIGKKFKHEEFGLQVVDALERIEGKLTAGLNLTFEVRDGIARHCGEDLQNCLIPSNEYDLNKHALPTTLEGCLVKLVDVVGYAPQDLRDLMYAEYTTWSDVPEEIKTVLGGSIRQMYDTLVKDIIQNSIGRNMIMMSPECFTALSRLKDFIIGIIKERFGPMEQELKRSIIKLYQRKKHEGILPSRIIDEFVGSTDKQLFDQMKFEEDFNLVEGKWFWQTRIFKLRSQND